MLPAPSMTADAIERAVHAYISRMPAVERTGSGQVYIKVDLGEPPSETRGRRTGVLFLSMPQIGADSEWLTKLMAHVRDGFERGEIETGDYSVRLEADQDFESFQHEQAGTVLLNLPATVIVEARP
jgi:hypothetical protein